MFRLLRSTFALGREVNFPILSSSSSSSLSSSSIHFKKMSRFNVGGFSNSVMKMNNSSWNDPPSNSNDEKQKKREKNSSNSHRGSSTSSSYLIVRINTGVFRVDLHGLILLAGAGLVFILLTRTLETESEITPERAEFSKQNVHLPFPLPAARTEEPEPNQFNNCSTLSPNSGSDECETIDFEQPEKKETEATACQIIHIFSSNVWLNLLELKTLMLLIPLINLASVGIKWKYSRIVNFIRFVSIAVCIMSTFNTNIRTSKDSKGSY